MKLVIHTPEGGDWTVVQDEDGIYREFTKKNSCTALDEQGDEWLIMNVVDKFYEVIE